VTAKVTTLEALGAVSAGFFDARAKGGDPQPREMELLDETSLRKNLPPMELVSWPPMTPGRTIQESCSN
jgi:hypothetical protein